MALFWVTIPVALLLFALAVGIPYWLSHKRLHPREHFEADAYLDTKDRADESVLPGQPGHSGRNISVGTQPIGRPRPTQADPEGQ